MSDVRGWHASPRRGVPATRHDNTGEIRIPLALFHLDQHEGDVELVLSKAESEQLHAELASLVNGGQSPVATGPR